VITTDRLPEGRRGGSCLGHAVRGPSARTSPSPPDNVEGHPFHAVNVNDIGITSIVRYRVLPLDRPEPVGDPIDIAS